MFIDYICKHQNSFVFFPLFKGNLVELLRMDINVKELLNSELFYRKVAFMNFPSHHCDDSTVMSVFNGSLFGLRYSYKEVIGKHLEDHDDDGSQPRKITYQINYRMNMLPHVF